MATRTISLNNFIDQSTTLSSELLLLQKDWKNVKRNINSSETFGRTAESFYRRIEKLQSELRILQESKLGTGQYINNNPNPIPAGFFTAHRQALEILKEKINKKKEAFSVASSKAFIIFQTKPTSYPSDLKARLGIASDCEIDPQMSVEQMKTKIRGASVLYVVSHTARFESVCLNKDLLDKIKQASGRVLLIAMTPGDPVSAPAAESLLSDRRTKIVTLWIQNQQIVRGCSDPKLVEIANWLNEGRLNRQ